MLHLVTVPETFDEVNTIDGRAESGYGLWTLTGGTAHVEVWTMNPKDRAPESNTVIQAELTDSDRLSRFMNYTSPKIEKILDYSGKIGGSTTTGSGPT